MMKSEYGFIVVFSESQSVEVRYTDKMRNGLQRANRNDESRSMGDGVKHLVINSLHMIVCDEWMLLHQAGWHHR